jgi:hypothetical protein
MKPDTRYRRDVLKCYRAARCEGLPARRALNAAKCEARYEGKQCEGVIKLPFGFELKLETQHDDGVNPFDDHYFGKLVECSENSLSEHFGKWLVYTSQNRVCYYDWVDTLKGVIKDFPNRERAMQAMRNECERMHAYCADQWAYIGIVVTLYRNDEKIDRDSVWGIESDDEGYITSVSRGMAAGMLRPAHKKFFAERGDGWKQYELEFKETSHG